MSVSKSFIFPLSLSIAVAACCSAEEQDEGYAHISGEGVEQIAVMPDTVRATTVIQEKGTALKDLLAALRQRSGEIEAGLKKLGAVEGSIKVVGPKIRKVTAEQMRQLREMMQRFRRKKIEKKAKEITVSMTVSAEWPLKGEGLDAQILEVADLETKITEVVTPKEEESDEDEEDEEDEDEDEDEEDLDEYYDRYSGEQQMKPGTVVMVYLKRISKEEIEKARKVAFKKAREDAEEIAAVAGFTLGKLTSVNRGYLGAEMDEEEDWSGHAYAYSRYLRRARTGTAKGGEAEAMSPTLKQLSYRVSMSASWQLIPKGQGDPRRAFGRRSPLDGSEYWTVDWPSAWVWPSRAVVGDGIPSLPYRDGTEWQSDAALPFCSAGSLSRSSVPAFEADFRGFLSDPLASLAIWLYRVGREGPAPVRSGRYHGCPLLARYRKFVFGNPVSE